MSEERLTQLFRRILNKKQDTDLFRMALTGDGSDADTADVVGRPGWAWVRYDEKQDKASQVINDWMPGVAQDVPVIVGKKYPSDHYYRIIDLNRELYYQHATDDSWRRYLLPNHGANHTAGSGSDPVPINTGNIVNGMVHETTPETLRVYVESLRYEYNGSLKFWAGSDIDLTSYVPVSSSYHRYVVVCIAIATNTLTAISGAQSVITVFPALPTIPAGNIPLAAVLIRGGATSIDNNDISDYRILFQAVGGMLQAYTNALALIAAEYDYAMTIHVVNGG